jgi:hypothetical protein
MTTTDEIPWPWLYSQALPITNEHRRELTVCDVTIGAKKMETPPFIW